MAKNSKYKVLIEAYIDPAQLQKEIDKKVGKKAVKVQAKVELDAKQAENQIQRWQNALAKMQARSPKAFAAPEVQLAKQGFEGLFDTFRKGEISLDDMRIKLDNVRTEMTKVTSSMNTANKAGMSLNEMFTLAVKKVAIWLAATGAIYGTLRQVGEGIQYIRDLDQALTDVQIVTGMTSDQISGLATQFNDLAREMGATTIEIAEGSLEWFRQGKTIQETSELMRSATVLTKLGNLDAAESTELLTSTLNGFKLEAEDTMSVVDRLIAVDNAYATSAGEIATALKYSANSAQQVGVSLEELISYVTVVSSVTRKSAESIGQSFKTMFARLENIKLGQLFEEDPGTLNDVEKALSLVNIQIRDTENSFRDMGDVIAEIASKWNTMTEVEQSAIATAVAGVRQRENFLILMNNFNQVLEAQEIQYGATGLASERYEAYLDSIEAHANNFKTAMEAMWQATLDSNAVKNFIDLGTGIIDLITNMGGLIPVLQNVVGLLIAFNAELILTNILSFGKAITTAKIALGGFATTLAEVVGLIGVGVSPTVALTTAFGALTVTAYSLVAILGSVAAIWGAWNTYIKQTQEQGLEGTANQWISMFSNLGDEARTTTGILDAYIGAVDAINKAHESANWFISLFVDKQKILEQGLIQTIDRLKITSTSYIEYISAVEKATEAAGFFIDENGRIYQKIETTNGELIRYVDNLEIATAQEIVLKNASDELADAFTGVLVKLTGINNVQLFDPNVKDEVFNLKDALNGLSELVDGKLGDSYDNFVEKQQELYQELANLNAKLQEAQTFEPSLERDTEIYNLRQEIEETNQAIEENANVHEEATRRILYNMLLQKLEQRSLAEEWDESTSQMAYSMVYNLGMAWGLVDQMTVDAAMSIDRTLGYLSAGNIKLAQQEVLNLGAMAQSIAGDYQIRFLISYVEESGLGANYGPPAPVEPQIPPGGFYPKGFGGGGGGSGSKAKKDKAVQEEKISMQDLFNMIINLIKQEKREEIDLLRSRQDELKKEQDLLEAQSDALDEQLDAYKDIIDAKKESLRETEDELSYQEEIADRNKSIAKLEQELALVSLDNSLEAQARKLELQEELQKEIDDLEKTQRKHSLDEQEKALDKEYELYESRINAEKELLEERSRILEEQKALLDEQIDAIQEFLGKSGLIAQEALDRMAEAAPELYEKLIAWNEEYGSGIQEDVVDAWEEAYKALERYGDLLKALRGESSSGGGGGSSGDDGSGERLNWKRRYGIKEGSADWEEALELGKKKFLEKHPEYKEHHTGLQSGPVGDFKTKTNEVFSKLFKGEVVLNKGDMINTIMKIPQMAQAMNEIGGNNITIEKLINVEGSIDEKVLPSIKDISKEVVKDLHTTLLKRGYNRGVQLYSS